MLLLVLLMFPLPRNLTMVIAFLSCFGLLPFGNESFCGLRRGRASFLCLGDCDCDSVSCGIAGECGRDEAAIISFPHGDADFLFTLRPPPQGEPTKKKDEKNRCHKNDFR